MVSSVALPIKSFSVSGVISGVLTYFYFQLTGKSDKKNNKKYSS
jgi:hypothetical protein